MTKMYWLYFMPHMNTTDFSFGLNFKGRSASTSVFNVLKSRTKLWQDEAPYKNIHPKSANNRFHHDTDT